MKNKLVFTILYYFLCNYFLQMFFSRKTVELNKEMKAQKTVLLGYNAFPCRFNKPLLNATHHEILEYFSSKTNLHGRLLLALIQYLQQYTKYFDRIYFVLSYEQDIVWTNGTLEGLLRKINQSKIDVGVNEVHMNALSIDAVNFAYPYKLENYTFATRNPKYKPHIFGIFQTFSLPVWLTVTIGFHCHGNGKLCYFEKEVYLKHHLF